MDRRKCRFPSSAIARFFFFSQPVRASFFIAVSSLVHTSAAAGEAATTSARTNLADLPLESLVELEVQTVYGASKYEQKTTAAPSSVTVITAEEINRYGYRTLADILESVQGLYVSYDRNHAFLGSRGLNLGDYNSRILLLVNGHRLNNDLTDGAYIDTAFALDVDLIDRVEIIRGPGSVLYGNNAFFGVINVITRQANQVGGREISGQYGENATYKGRLTYGEVFTNGLQLMLSGTVGGSDGAGKLFYRSSTRLPTTTASPRVLMTILTRVSSALQATGTLRPRAPLLPATSKIPRPSILQPSTIRG